MDVNLLEAYSRVEEFLDTSWFQSIQTEEQLLTASNCSLVCLLSFESLLLLLKGSAVCTSCVFVYVLFVILLLSITYFLFCLDCFLILLAVIFFFCLPLSISTNVGRKIENTEAAPNMKQQYLTTRSQTLVVELELTY